MQQGLKLQQSGNSAKLLLAEAVHRGTMRFESVSQIGDSIRGLEKEHQLERIISFKCNSVSGGKSSFQEILLIKLVRTKSVCAIQVQGKVLQSNQEQKFISSLSGRPKQTRLRRIQFQLIEIISQRIQNSKVQNSQRAKIAATETRDKQTNYALC